MVLIGAAAPSLEPASNGSHCSRVEYPSQARFFFVHCLHWGYVSSHLSFLALQVQQPVNVFLLAGRSLVDREFNARLVMATPVIHGWALGLSLS